MLGHSWLLPSKVKDSLPGNRNDKSFLIAHGHDSCSSSKYRYRNADRLAVKPRGEGSVLILSGAICNAEDKGYSFLVSTTSKKESRRDQGLTLLCPVWCQKITKIAALCMFYATAVGEAGQLFTASLLFLPE